LQSRLREHRCDGDQEGRQMGVRPRRLRVHGSEPTGRELSETESDRRRRLGRLRLRRGHLASLRHNGGYGEQLCRPRYSWLGAYRHPARESIRSADVGTDHEKVLPPAWGARLGWAARGFARSNLASGNLPGTSSAAPSKGCETMNISMIG